MYKERLAEVVAGSLPGEEGDGVTAPGSPLTGVKGALESTGAPTVHAHVSPPAHLLVEGVPAPTAKPLTETPVVQDPSRRLGGENGSRGDTGFLSSNRSTQWSPER